MSRNVENAYDQGFMEAIRLCKEEIASWNGPDIRFVLIDFEKRILERAECKNGVAI